MADKTVHISFGEDISDHAVLLLAAAEELDLDASVVATTDHSFVVPEEVAKKAGVEPDPEEDDEAEAESETEEPAPKKAAPRKRAAKKTAAPRTASKE